VRFTLAESLAKEASRTASSFGSMFVPNVTSTLPADAGPSIQERTKAHLALMSDRKAEAQRDNDLIYNAILPTAEALPPIDKAVVANPISIQEVYGTPEVQKTIGQDFFGRLIPLSVHESASVYSEEKAKLVRSEVENSESAEVAIRSALDSFGVKEGLARFRAMAEGEVGADAEIPVDVKRWKDDISFIEGREAVDGVISQLNRLKETVKTDLERVSDELEAESRDCEMMRIKYEQMWTQAPSAGFSKTLRQDLKAHMSALEAAQASDNQVYTLWDQIRGEIRLLLSPQIEDVFRASTETEGASNDNLLDLDIGKESTDGDEREKIGRFVADIDQRLGTLNKISRERKEIIRELKEKVSTSFTESIVY
jgi:tyrosine-protein phosphatase non-receptor type 23